MNLLHLWCSFFRIHPSVALSVIERRRRIQKLFKIISLIYTLAMKILGIETSCDETSAAVVEAKRRVTGHMPVRQQSWSHVTILSNIISSQIDLHKKYGGVVPEVASRAHIEAIIPIVEESLKKAKVKLKDIGVIAVTNGPGLIGSLLVGVNTTKAFSFILKKPLIAVNHLEGHIYANFINVQNVKNVVNEKNKQFKQAERYNNLNKRSDIEFPAVILIASGGHTMLVYMKEHLKYRILGETKDDAAGEAFDKVAKILDLGYPGGPIIEKLANKGNPLAFDFPKAEMEEKTIRTDEGFLKKIPPNLDFSFSGLKTSVLYQFKSRFAKASRDRQAKQSSNLNKSRFNRDDITFITGVCASFQKAVIDVLMQKTIWAAERTKAKSILISGGVAANEMLRDRLNKEARKIGSQFTVPPKILCTDNAAMVAAAGYFKARAGKFSDFKKIAIDPNLKLK